MKPQRFCFRSYTILPIVALLPEDTSNSKGGFSYLMNDVGMRSFAYNLERRKFFIFVITFF